MSKTNDPDLPLVIAIAALRGAIAMTSLALAMAKTRTQMSPRDRAALRDVERRRLPEMKDRLWQLEQRA